ncbi:MAG TPA: glycosyltransferase family 4 protein, partial [Bdellovibrionales bacterium]|nr:glycosyltransferase family 4 protein [Bdellovibrionales bacterium]
EMSQPMRILLTAYDFRPNLGGVATVAYELAHALTENDCEVLVLAPRHEKAEDAGVSFRLERRPFSSNSWIANAQFISEINRVTRKWKADAILHTVWFPEAVHAVLDRETPHFQIVHGSEVMESARTLRKSVRRALTPLKRKVFQSMKGVFAVSHFTRDLVVRECGLEPSRIRVVENGVNTAEFFPDTASPEFRARMGAAGKRTIVTLNRLGPYKGNDTILKALPSILREIPNAHLVMAGSGPDQARLQKLAESLGVAEHVKLPGALAFSERRSLYALSDLVMLMTRTDYYSPDCEGFGLVLLEAAACGKAVVASRDGGIPDAVLHGETGLLVNPHDPQEVAVAAVDILSDDSFRRALETRALAHAREMSWNRMARKILTEMRAHVRN